MNAGHPDRNAFERFSRGEATAAEERWIEDHLRSDCALCQGYVDELLTCSFDPDAPPLEEDPAAQDASWDRLFATLGNRLSRAASERH